MITEMTDQQQEPHEQLICSNCGNPLEGGDRYCIACGIYIIAEGVEIPCKRCGKPVKGNFCPNCGSPLEVTEKEREVLEGRGRKPADVLRKMIGQVIRGITKIFFFIIDAIFGLKDNA